MANNRETDDRDVFVQRRATVARASGRALRADAAIATRLRACFLRIPRRDASFVDPTFLRYCMRAVTHLM